MASLKIHAERDTARLLLRLADFGVEVESAWDAPRGLSLPGLAEHLGLVRSAIHNPLKELESSGLISTRSPMLSAEDLAVEPLYI